MDASNGLKRVAAVAHEHDALDHVGVVVLAHDAQPWGRADADVGHVAHAHGNALGRADSDVADVLHGTNQAHPAHVERLLAQGDALATHVLVGVRDGGLQLRQGHASPAQAIGIDLDVVLFGQAAETDHVDHARNLPELLFQNPILRGLQVGKRVALTHNLVAKELPDGAPGRKRGRHARRQRNEGELVEHPLLRDRVRCVPSEIALNVGESEQRLRPDVFQARHADQSGFQRHRDVALDLLCTPALRLRDDLDHGRHRVGVGLNVELEVRAQPDP